MLIEDGHHHSNDRMNHPSKETCDSDDSTCSSNPTMTVENEVFLQEESLDVLHLSEQTSPTTEPPAVNCDVCFDSIAFFSHTVFFCSHYVVQVDFISMKIERFQVEMNIPTRMKHLIKL